MLDGSTLAGLRAYVRAHLSATDDTGQNWSTQVSGGEVVRVDRADNLVLAATRPLRRAPSGPSSCTTP